MHNVYTQISRKKFDQEERNIDFHVEIEAITQVQHDQGFVYHPLVQTYLYLADELVPELEGIKTPKQGIEYLEPKLGLTNRKFTKLMKGNKRDLRNDVNISHNTKYKYQPDSNLSEVKQKVQDLKMKRILDQK